MVHENERTPLTEIQTMTTNEIKPAVLIAGAATAIASASHAAEAASVDDLVAKIKSTDDKVRGPAWQGAGPVGAPAVKPLAAVMTDADFEIARSAKRALCTRLSATPVVPARRRKRKPWRRN